MQAYDRYGQYLKIIVDSSSLANLKDFKEYALSLTIPDSQFVYDKALQEKLKVLPTGCYALQNKELIPLILLPKFQSKKPGLGPFIGIGLRHIFTLDSGLDIYGRNKMLLQNGDIFMSNNVKKYYLSISTGKLLKDSLVMFHVAYDHYNTFKPFYLSYFKDTLNWHAYLKVSIPVVKSVFPSPFRIIAPVQNSNGFFSEHYFERFKNNYKDTIIGTGYNLVNAKTFSKDWKYIEPRAQRNDYWFSDVSQPVMHKNAIWIPLDQDSAVHIFPLYAVYSIGRDSTFTFLKYSDIQLPRYPFIKKKLHYYLSDNYFMNDSLAYFRYAPYVFNPFTNTTTRLKFKNYKYSFSKDNAFEIVACGLNNKQFVLVFRIGKRVFLQKNSLDGEALTTAYDITDNLQTPSDNNYSLVIIGSRLYQMNNFNFIEYDIL